MADRIYKFNRYSIRLNRYDYSKPGYYYITLCTQDRDKRFGVIVDKEMQLNDIGRMIDLEWKQIPNRFKHTILDKYIIMPDHFHGIIQIISNKKIPAHDKNLLVCNENNVGTPLVGVHYKKTTLFEIIGAFKSITTHKYIDGVTLKNWPRFRKRLWQLRYHDRIIRNENELSGIRKYIITNPLNYHPRIQRKHRRNAPCGHSR